MKKIFEYTVFLILFTGCDEDTFTRQVDTPVFSIEEGTYDTTQIVTITSATPDADIRYTLDGSDPEFGTLYSAPILFEENGSYTINAIAKKAEMEQSELSVLEFEIDFAYLKCRPKTITMVVTVDSVYTEYTFDEQFRPVTEYNQIGRFRSKYEYEYQQDRTLIHGYFSDEDGILPATPTLSGTAIYEEELLKEFRYEDDQTGRELSLDYQFFYTDRLLTSMVFNGDTSQIRMQDGNVIYSSLWNMGACEHVYDDKINPFHRRFFPLWTLNWIIGFDNPVLFVVRYFSTNNLVYGCGINQYYTYEYGPSGFPLLIKSLNTVLDWGNLTYNFQLEYTCP